MVLVLVIHDPRILTVSGLAYCRAFVMIAESFSDPSLENAMRLYATATSPYARKVRIAIKEKGLACEVEWVDLRDQDHPASQHNPLGKVPVLVDSAGEGIYDSTVIIQYLELFHPEPPILPTEPREKLRCLRMEALADGIMDSTVAWVMEHRRNGECQDGMILEKMRGKVLAALAFLQQDIHKWSEAHNAKVLDLAQISTIAAIGYVDLRAPEFLVPYPDLHQWYQQLGHRASVAETVPA